MGHQNCFGSPVFSVAVVQRMSVVHSAPVDKPQYYMLPPCVVLWVYRAGGAGFLQEQQSIDPPSMAKPDAAQPRYRPVPSSYLQQYTQH